MVPRIGPQRIVIPSNKQRLPIIAGCFQLLGSRAEFPQRTIYALTTISFWLGLPGGVILLKPGAHIAAVEDKEAGLLISAVELHQHIEKRVLVGLVLL